MINKKNIFMLMIATFILLGCGSNISSDTDTSSDVQNQDEQANSNNGSQDEQLSEEKETYSQDLLIKSPVIEEKPSNWYIRLVAEDPVREMKTGSAQLGELERSDTVEKYTLKALSPFGGSYLDIIFRNPAGMDAGNYKVNFHIHAEVTEDRWSFIVRTDNVNADILLTWRGLYVLTPYIDGQDRSRYKEYRTTTNPLIKNMKLVDVSTGNEIAAEVDGKVQTYSFNMDGQKERTFEWVVQIDEVVIP